MSGQEGGEIPLGALALGVPGNEEGKVRLLVRVRMDGGALLAGQTGNVLRIETALYALGEGGGIQASALETIEIDLASKRAAVERGGVDLLAGLDLRPGPYSLRMLARNLETGKLAVRILPVTVPDAASLAGAPLLSPPPAEGDPRPTTRAAGLGPLDPPPFPDDAPTETAAISSPGPAMAAVTAPAPIPETAEGRRLRTLARTAYRESLALLAADREADALAAAAGFEDSLLLRAEHPVSVALLIDVETGVLRELAEADAESLVPALRLHQRLYEKATERRRLQGSTLAREVLLQGADRLRDRRLAHLFVAAFGAELMRGGVRHQGGQTLQRALAEDPADAIARMELAADAERRGDHAGAAGHLEILLRAHPEDREARLRMAVDLARLGRTAEAEERLTALIAEETGGWRLSVACQELARIAPAKAERTLREGLKRLPGDEKLTLLLASTLERSGRAGEARQVIAAFRPQGDGGGARHRYSSPPLEPLATALAELGREAAARLPALASALERTKP